MLRADPSHGADLKYHIWLQLLGSSLTILVVNVKQQIKVSSWQRDKLLTLHWSVQIGKYSKQQSLLGGKEGGKKARGEGSASGGSKRDAKNCKSAVHRAAAALLAWCCYWSAQSFNIYASQQKVPYLATCFTNICIWCRAVSGLVGGDSRSREFNYQKKIHKKRNLSRQAYRKE